MRGWDRLGKQAKSLERAKMGLRRGVGVAVGAGALGSA